MRVFISHDSDDVELAKALVNLLQKSLLLASRDIRCSSVDGYRLEGGVSFDEELRIEVHEAELVIGLITPLSLRSLYVAFELGARWGISKPMIPILASGATPNHLGGPLSGINALDCNNESQVSQLLEESARHLGVGLESASSYLPEIKMLSKLSSEAQADAENSPAISATQMLSPEATEMLTTVANTGDGILNVIRLNSGRIIRSNARHFNDLRDPRSTATWTDALDELVSYGYLRDERGDGKLFEVSGKGYDLVATLEE